MRVLLITFSFPPAGGVGVLRALSLAKYLPENGIQLDVLTARNAPAVIRDPALLQQVPESVTIHRTWTADLPFALRKGVKRLLFLEGKKAASAPTVAKVAGKPNPLRSFVANLLLPDPQIGWLPFAGRAAKRIIRKREIEAVIITVPPFSSVMMAKTLRKHFPSLPIVVDFRDEWLQTTIELVSLNANPRAREVAAKTEAEAVKAATAVVAVTEAAQAAIRSRYPAESASKFVCVSNGFDGPLPTVQKAEAKSAGERVVLTYLGTVYRTTHPQPFVDAVLSLPPEVRSRLLVRFIGHVEQPSDRDVLQRMGESVEIIGFMPQAEALRRIAESDYMLVLSQDPINVSAKLYDYLGSGKPILAAVHPQGDVRRRLEETHAGRWADISDPPAIAQMLTDAVMHADDAPAPDSHAIARYHRAHLARQYSELLHRLVSERSA